MIRRLRIKIIAVTLATLLLVFAAVLLVLNISVHQTSVNRTEEFMASVVEDDGFLFTPEEPAPAIPAQITPAPAMDGVPAADGTDEGWRADRGGGQGRFAGPEMMRASRFFFAKVNADGAITELNLDMMFDFTDTEAREYVAEALQLNAEKGELDNFSFLAAEKPYGQIVVFAERSVEILMLEQLTKTSLWAAGIVSLILAVLSVFLARWMTAPVKTAFDKQRRFVSDASHELKTPLTIISANVEALQNEWGENRRLDAVRTQSGRMNELIHDLLTLAKADEGGERVLFSAFDLSGAILNAALEFDSRAFEEGKQYSCEIAENISYTGDEKQIKQLTGILIDNAIRYSENRGRIEVSLSEKNGRPRLSVFNTGAGVREDEREKLFERFYRSDESRARETGGYGVGLSIAKAITESHKGKIQVSGEYGKWIRFEVLL
jgi:signal transduction histidine kinase